MRCTEKGTGLWTINRDRDRDKDRDRKIDEKGVEAEDIETCVKVEVEKGTTAETKDAHSSGRNISHDDQQGSPS